MKASEPRKADLAKTTAGERTIRRGSARHGVEPSHRGRATRGQIQLPAAWRIRLRGRAATHTTAHNDRGAWLIAIEHGVRRMGEIARALAASGPRCDRGLRLPFARLWVRCPVVTERDRARVPLFLRTVSGQWDRLLKVIR